MTSLICNVDTTNSQYLENSPLCTYSNVSNVSYLTPNSFACRVQLPFVLYGVYRILLKSVELPIMFNNIRSTSNLNTIGIYSGLDASGNKLNHYEVILNDNYYSTISSLLTEINNLFTTNYPSINVVFSQNSTNSNYLQVTSTTFSSIYVDTTNLSSMLGFNSNINSMSANLTIAQIPYKLSIDDYVNLYIANTSNNNINTSKVNSSFKIPLNAVNNVVFFHEPSSNNYVNCSFNTLSYLDVYIYDRLGYSLNSNGTEFSFSLEIQFIMD